MIRRRTLTAPLAAIAVVLVLAACSSTQRPGAAAMVDGVPIDDQTVAALATEVRSVTGAAAGDEGAAEVNRQVISNLVQSAVIGQAAARAGVTVTAGQVDDLINSAAQQSGGLEALQKSLATQYGVAPSQLEDFAKANLQYRAIADKLSGGDSEAGSAKAGAEIAALSVELGTTVNPRFGTWIPAQLNVGPPSDDLSQPASAAGKGGVTVPLPGSG